MWFSKISLLGFNVGWTKNDFFGNTKTTIHINTINRNPNQH